MVLWLFLFGTQLLEVCVQVQAASRSTVCRMEVCAWLALLPGGDSVPAGVGTRDTDCQDFWSPHWQPPTAPDSCFKLLVL